MHTNGDNPASLPPLQQEGGLVLFAAVSAGFCLLREEGQPVVCKI